MAKTTAMRLIELMVYKDDIHQVLKYLGKLGEFQFQQDLDKLSAESENVYKETFDELEKCRVTLEIDPVTDYTEAIDIPSDDERCLAREIIERVKTLHDNELSANENYKHLEETYKEALAFSNLKVSYDQLESMTFLILRIGKISDGSFETLKEELGFRAIVARLGDNDNRIMIACSKKSKVAVDSELKKVGFVELEVPKDFRGIPDDVLGNLKDESDKALSMLEEIRIERKNYALTHKDSIIHLLERYSVGMQLFDVESKLESTEYVYRISGWIPAYISGEVIKNLDEMTEGRCAARVFLPEEVRDVINGKEKVPVELKHGKVVANFERMIFSYGAPLYGTVDPTPFVAIFFTILFGIMFGDAGQGLVFLIIGILMCVKKFKLMGWEKFGPVFVCIGISSTIMGILTGEVFANAEILAPFSRAVTGLFGESRDQILEVMPDGSSESIKNMFIFFGFTVGIGFIINSIGLIINIINNFSLKRKSRALFGKNGISGALFFWYLIFFALRVALLGLGPFMFDWIILGLTLIITAFSEPIQRIIDKESPVLENGLLSAIIAAIVEIIEVISSYISNTVSFLRVGAFALSHAILSYIIHMMVGLVGGAGGIAISIFGNAIIIALEGMIVAIQVVRLQYYEFFSKFFSETGREFKPFSIRYGVNA